MATCKGWICPGPIPCTGITSWKTGRKVPPVFLLLVLTEADSKKRTCQTWISEASILYPMLAFKRKNLV
jgi:hypothetical protein